jgi:hypothetical protein
MAGEDASPDGVGRRTVMKRAGLVAGATVWTTPLVQSLAAPAFATGSEQPLSGFRACVVGEGRIQGGGVVAGRLSTPMDHVSFRIVGPLCCGHSHVEIQVKARPENQQAGPQEYVFDSGLTISCSPELSCSDCPAVVTGSATGESRPQGNAAVLSFRFENVAPTPGQRGEAVDLVSLTITTATHTLSVSGLPQPDPEGTGIECSSC